MHLNPTIAALLESINHPSLPGIDLSLVRMQALLAALGDPQKKLPPVIHVAGTNGKGSTIAFMRAIYVAAGYRVHAYTSPHLVRFNERLVLANHEISDAQLLAYLTRVAAVAKTIPVTFFEATTAMAFLAFAENEADIVLLETGLGGRLDATNLVPNPVATLLTPIGMDHMEFLGPTVAQIAREKAGIMKHGVPCFSATQVPEVDVILREAARATQSPFLCVGHEAAVSVSPAGITLATDAQRWNLPLPVLAGAHQYQNAALAALVTQSIGSLPVSPDAFARGLSTAHWPARLQVLHHGPICDAWGARGAVVLDGGHNAHAAAALAQWVRQQSTPVTLLCGMMARKDARTFFQPLVGVVREIITLPVEEEGGYDPEALAQAAREAGITQVRACHDQQKLAAWLGTCDPGALLIAGSLFLAGEILKNHG